MFILVNVLRNVYRSLMPRWLGQDVISMPLDSIESEIASIESRPLGDRSVIDVERLEDLRAARKQIKGKSRSYCGL